MSKIIYVPRIVLTDNNMPLIDGNYQFIAANIRWELNHSQAIEWVLRQTKNYQALGYKYQIEMNAHVLDEELA